MDRRHRGQQGVWTRDHAGRPNNHNTWNGCVMDRGFSTTPDTTNNYDTNVAPPDVTNTSSLYAAEQYGSCPQAAMGLNYDWTTMNSLVNNMSPNGNTNQAIGLQLGWLSLVGGGPFTAPAMDSNYKYTQVIILLTDGLNTQDRWYTSQSSIDARQQLTCNNINAAGITLYTIQVNTGGDPTSTLLQNCAGSPASIRTKQVLPADVGEPDPDVFNQIGTELSHCAIAQYVAARQNKKPGQSSRALSLTASTLTRRNASTDVTHDATYFAFAIRVSNGL